MFRYLQKEVLKYGQQNQCGDYPPKPEPLTGEQLQQFEDMLKSYETAYTNFVKISCSARKTYAASYFLCAKTEAGKQKRLSTIIERLNLNLNPMESMKKTNV